MVMPKHPVKTVGNSFSTQILFLIGKSISKNTASQMEAEKIEFKVI